MKRKSTLFLMEQLIAIVIFAVCAAVCVRFFAESFVMASENRDVKNALVAAESGAECYKAFSGDVAKLAETLNGTGVGGAVTVLYDEDWLACNGETARFEMRIESRPSDYGALLDGKITVRRIAGDELVSFSVLTRRNGHA